jgi:stearoyl-CoA desaturase (delta-9 desaturase)
MTSDLHYTNIVYILGHHVLALYALYNLPSVFSYRLLFEVFMAYQLIGTLGITAGAHRLWSHRSYTALAPVRFILMLANSAAHQGSIYHWVRDHRMHHKHTDTELDPHSIEYGFMYSHMGWLFFRRGDKFRAAAREIGMSDIENDGFVMFQHRNYFAMSQLFCFVLPTLYGYYAWDSMWIGYFYFGVVRWIVLLHATWCVNSVAHMWGSTPYNERLSSRQNAFTSLVAAGEGWHNYHHAYPYDYRASEFNWHSEWNPTTLLLDGLGLIGCVSNRKVGLTPGARQAS